MKLGGRQHTSEGCSCLIMGSIIDHTHSCNNKTQPPVKEGAAESCWLEEKGPRAKAAAVARAVPHLLDGSIFIDAHFCKGGGANGLSTRVHDLHHQPLLAGLPPKHSARPISCNLHWVSPTHWRDSPLTRPCTNFQP